MGYAFTFHVVAWLTGVPIGAYVHYPTISTDMLARVQSRKKWHTNSDSISSSPILSRGKLLYELSPRAMSRGPLTLAPPQVLPPVHVPLRSGAPACVVLDGQLFVDEESRRLDHRLLGSDPRRDSFADRDGGCSIVLRDPSSSTARVVERRAANDTEAVDDRVSAMRHARDVNVRARGARAHRAQHLPVPVRAVHLCHKTNVLIGPLHRPEKDHQAQLRALAHLLREHPEYKSSSEDGVRLVLIGGSRNADDAARVEGLRALAKELSVEVTAKAHRLYALGLTHASLCHAGPRRVCRQRAVF